MNAIKYSWIPICIEWLMNWRFLTKSIENIIDNEANRMLDNYNPQKLVFVQLFRISCDSNIS